MVVKRYIMLWIKSSLIISEGFPGSSVIKDPPTNAGDLDSNPGLERFPGEENGNPFQYCCMENSMDRRAWQDIVHGVENEMDTT